MAVITGKVIGQVDLSSVSKIKEFVSKTIVYQEDLHLLSDKWIVDAKSVLGIFSLDLSKPITLEIDTDNDAVLAEAKKAFKDFLI